MEIILSILILLSLVASFFLGMLTRNNWIAAGLPAMTPAAVAVIRLAIAPNPGFGEALLYLSPFLIGITLGYYTLCFFVARAGRALHARFS